MLIPAPRISHFTAADGYRFAVRVWEARKPIGRVVCLHGIISHGGWYSASCRRLALSGLEVHFLDRRGSGLNAAARGDVDRWQTWLEDVEGYLGQLPADLPRSLLGISWGGKLAVAVARRKRQPINALALLCPGLFAKKGANVWQRAALRMAGAVGLGARRVKIPLCDPALFTDRPEWQAFVGSDPLTLRELTIRAALADLELTRYATATPEEIDIPVLLMLAGRDRIIANGLVRRFVGRMRSADKQTLEYAEAAHTFEFEPEPERFLEDLCGWAREKGPGSVAR